MSTVTPPPVESKREGNQQASGLISKGVRARPLFDPEIVRRATKESFVKLNPMKVAKNPVMFVVEVGAALTTIYVIKDAVTGAGNLLFGIQIALWFLQLCSPTLRKPWRKREAKRKPTPCARPRPIRLRIKSCQMASSRWYLRHSCAPGMSCTAKRVILFREMEKSLTALLASMSPSSPERVLPSLGIGRRRSQ